MLHFVHTPTDMNTIYSDSNQLENFPINQMILVWRHEYK